MYNSQFLIIFIFFKMHVYYSITIDAKLILVQIKCFIVVSGEFLNKYWPETFTTFRTVLQVWVTCII